MTNSGTATDADIAVRTRDGAEERLVVDAKFIGFLMGLLCWVLVLRAPPFLVSAIAWDEGLYILMASQWLGGPPPYTTVFEIKPIGIFAIFAAALGVLGDSIVSIRFITVAVVFLTSVVLLLLAKRLFRGEVAGVVAAISFPVLTLGDRKSTRLNSSHLVISYAVFCLKK